METTPRASTEREGVWRVPLICGALLLFEYLVVAFAFDVQPALDRGGAWSGLSWLRELGVVAALGVASTSVAVVRWLPAPPRWGALHRGWVFGHAALFGVFVLLTWLVLGRAAPPSGSPLLWLAVWLAAGGASALALLGAAFGRSILSPVALGVVASGMVLGGLALLVGQWSRELWDSLAGATFRVAYLFLRVGFPDAVADQESRILGASGFHVEVAAPCSGYEGMGLISVLTPAYLWAFRGHLRFPRALLLLPIAVTAVWFANALRVATLVAIGALGAPGLAVGVFHSKLGWVFFCGIALGTLWLGSSVRYFARPQGGATEPLNVGGSVSNPAAPFLVPMLAVFATALLTSNLSPGLDRLYGLRIAAGGVAAAWFLERYRGLDWRVSWLGPGVGLAVGIAWVLTAGERRELAPEVLATIPAFWFVTRVVGSILVIPLCEELSFRGYLFRRLQNSRFEEVPLSSFTWLSLGGSSLAFGVLHERWFAATLAGIAYALVLVRTGRFGEAFAAHAASNLVVAAWVLGTGDWSQWL